MSRKAKVFRVQESGEIAMRTVRVTAFMLFALALAEVSLAQSERHTLDIKPQPMKLALRDLGEQTGLQILFRAEDVAEQGVVTPISGEMSPEEALEKMLAGSPRLKYEWMNAHTVLISAKEGSAIEKAMSSAATEGVRMAQMDTPSASSATPASGESSTEDGESTKLDEIVVTAQKRIQRLQDVPAPVTTLDPASLTASSQFRLQDYYTKIPGLALTPSTQSQQILSIRGVTAGSGNPTVGVMVDDVPYGSSTFNGGGQIVPDIDPGDLARVEVLRGPQGTLYGASSIGGLIKFVTADPSTEQLRGRLAAGINSVANGHDPGHDFRGSVNVPLGDTFAVRASGFTRRDPGYVDNVFSNEDAVNSTDADGGRVSALWRPSEQLSLKLSALIQKLTASGGADVNPALDDLQQNRLPGTGGYSRKAQLYSATLSAKLAGANLDAISGYGINTVSTVADFSAIFATPSSQVADNETRKFSQEIRLSADTGWGQWLLGGFYTDEDTDYDQFFYALNPATGDQTARLLTFSFPTTYEEYAAFGDVLFHVTDRLDIQLGARQSEIRQTYNQTTLSAAGAVSTIPERRARPNAFTYLATAQYELRPDFMIYTRLASGYRSGGPNTSPQNSVVPGQYEPDKSQNYEIGIKGDFLARLLSIDASVYHTDWKDIQLTLRNALAGVTYIDNAGKARSRGVELSVLLRPTSSLKVAGWAAWNDATLTEGLPLTSPTRASAGDRLPFNSRFSANLSLDQEFPLWKDMRGFVGGVASYTGERRGQFVSATIPRATFPEFTRVDLSMGVRSDSWGVDLFVNNLLDKRGIINSDPTISPFPIYFIQPRTVGVNLSRSF
jgi:outer membrane receptor protein involved in Fe transport